MAGYNPQDDPTRRENTKRYKKGVLAPGNGDWKPNQPTTYRPSTRYEGPAGEVANFFTDTARNLGNFWGNNSIQGGKTPQGGGAGDAWVGSNPANARRTVLGREARSSFGKGPAQGAEGPPSLMDLMAQLGGMFGGSEGGIVENPFVSYDPLRNSARSNAEASRVALQSVYKQMQDEVGSAGKAIDQRYTSAGEGIKSDRDNTMSAVKDAYASSANQQADIARTLGIESAVAQAIDEGRDVSSRGADVQGRVAERAQGDLGYTSAVGASEGTYNNRLGQAASQQGAYQQTRLQQELRDRLSEIDMAEQQANADRFSAVQGSGPDVMDIFSMAKYIDETNREGQMSNLEMQQSAYRDAMRDPNNLLAQLESFAPRLQESGLPDEYAKLFIQNLLKGGR